MRSPQKAQKPSVNVEFCSSYDEKQNRGQQYVEAEPGQPVQTKIMKEASFGISGSASRKQLSLFLAVLIVASCTPIATNAPAITALIIAALSVCGALFLILELDRPFGGMIGLSSEPMRNTLSQPGR
jgi:hypothetical protein